MANILKRRKASKKVSKTLKFIIDCTIPLEDEIFEMSEFRAWVNFGSEWISRYTKFTKWMNSCFRNPKNDPFFTYNSFFSRPDSCLIRLNLINTTKQIYYKSYTIKGYFSPFGGPWMPWSVHSNLVSFCPWWESSQ